MSLRRRLVLTLICLSVLLGAEGLFTTSLNREVAEEIEGTLGSALSASDRAEERALALAWVKVVTQELVTESYRQTRDSNEAAGARGLASVSAEVVSHLDHLEATLALRGLTTSSGGGVSELQRRLQEVFQRFRRETELLLALSRQNPELAHAHLNQVLEPLARDHLRPLIENRRLAAEEELMSRAGRVARKSRATTGVVLVVNTLALLMALVLALSLLRSTTRKVDQLVVAATAVGQGNLDTRVGIDSQDELGFLGATFNRMAEELARTTVSRADLNNILESMPGALFILDRDMKVEKANQAALALVGGDGDEVQGRGLADFCAAGPFALPNQLTLRPGERLKMEGTLFGSQGQRTTVLLSFSPLQGSGSEPSSFVCVAHDISERKKAENSLRGLLAEKDVLLREVHHRVKNNLQVISSLLDLQSSAQPSSGLRQLLGESRNRVRCMALIHEQLCRTSSRGRVDLGTYFRELTHAIASSHGSQSERIEVRLEIEDLSLDLDQAVAGGLIVNELVSNAFKHAFPGDAGGEVRLSFRLTPDLRYVLVVSDNGRGFPSDQVVVTESSLGLTLVEALVRQLGGTCTTDGSSGTTVTIEFPAPAEPQVHAA